MRKYLNLAEDISLAPRIFVIALLLIACSFFIATQYMASQFNYAPVLGESTFGALYPPHKAIQWTFSYGNQYRQIVLAGWMAGIASFASLVVGFLGFMLVASRRKANLTGHGSARWAKRDDIVRAGLIDTERNTTSLIVGGFKHPTKDIVEYLVHTGPESVIGYAPSRSGKGVTLVIPNLVSYEQSVFVHDIKGELWDETAGYRQSQLGQKVLYHNPSSTKEGNAHFNVIDEIRATEDTAVKDTQLICEYLIPTTNQSGQTSGGSSENDHFETSARSLLVGVILYELAKALKVNRPLMKQYALKIENEVDETEHAKILESYKLSRNIVNVTSILSSVTDPELEFRDYLTAMQGFKDIKCKYAHVIRQIGTEMQNRENREFSSVLSSLVNPLAIYRDPILAEATSRSDFSLVDLVEHKSSVSLYLIVSPSDTKRLRNYFGMIVNVLCTRLTERMPNKNYKRNNLLLMLDEFSKLPPLPIVQESLDHFAGYGIKAYIIVQDVQTITRLYGRNETIQSNCKVRIAFTPNKVETAEMLSKMVGSRTVLERTQNRQRQTMSAVANSVSDAESLHSRPLLTVDEIMQLPVPVLDKNERMVTPGESLVFVTGCRPIKGIQTPYFMDKEMKIRTEYTPPMISDVLLSKIPQLNDEDEALERLGVDTSDVQVAEDSEQDRETATM